MQINYRQASSHNSYTLQCMASVFDTKNVKHKDAFKAQKLHVPCMGFKETLAVLQFQTKVQAVVTQKHKVDLEVMEAFWFCGGIL